MLVPVRCFTCGYCVGKHYDAYVSGNRRGVAFPQLMEQMQIRRFCCKRMLLTHIDVAARVSQSGFRDSNAAGSRFMCTVQKSRTVSCD